MNTNVNTNVDFGTNNSNTNTNSSIGSTLNNNSSTYQNTYNSNGNVQTESMDLSFATEQVATESKSLLDSIGDFFSDLGEGLKNTGAAIVDGTKTVANWAINGLKDLGSNIKEACTNLASNVSSILGSTLSWAKDISKKVAATAAVVTTTVVSGVADIGEGIVDGLVWTAGKLIEGGTWLVGKVAGWFSDDAEEAVMEYREERKEIVKDFITHDWVGEANDWFYQETEIGKSINENSYLKYDSEAMQKLRGASEMVGKLVLATAATVATGGAAAPIALGFLFGTGEQAEKLYQENPNTTGAQELGIFVSGLGEALNWYAQGKLGEGGWNVLQTVNKLGIKTTGATALNAIKSVLSQLKKDGLINTLKGIKNSTSLASLKASDNLIDSLGIIADNYSDWLIGEEELNLKTAAKAGKELLSAWLSNMFFDGAGDYLINTGTKIKLKEIFGSHIEARNLDLDATVRLIPIDKLDELVKDSDLYTKFLDFENNTDLFGDYTKIELANALQDYIEGIKKNNYNFGYSAEQFDSVQNVINKFSLDPNSFNIDGVLEKYNSAFKKKIFFNQNPEIIFEPEFQIAMNDSLLEFAKQKGNYEYVNAAIEMQNYYSEGMETILSRDIDVGENNFSSVVSHFSLTDNPSNDLLIYIKKYYDDKGYKLSRYHENIANQLLRTIDLKTSERSIQSNIAKFAGAYANSGKVNSIYGSFIYRTEPAFIANYKKGTSAMAYNNGTNSVINLNYDTNLLKTNMTHESLHQVSSGIDYYDATGAYCSQAGIQISTWNSTTGKWDKKNRGLNEATTEYFSKLIHGDKYIKGTCGYEPMVDKLEQFIDSNLFTLDQLKEAYFTNNPTILSDRIDAVGTQIGIEDFGQKFLEAFDKANYSNNSDDIGKEAAQALEKEGMQLLSQYLKKIKLAGL